MSMETPLSIIIGQVQSARETVYGSHHINEELTTPEGRFIEERTLVSLACDHCEGRVLPELDHGAQVGVRQ